MRDNRSRYILMIILCAFVTLVSGCSSDEPARQPQRASNSVDGVFGRGKSVLKDVAEGINNAVYK